MHPGAPRDVDLPDFLRGLQHHPPTTGLTILAHEAARTLVAMFATSLWQLLPPGRDKSLAFTELEDVLMRANRAIALNGGPKDTVQAQHLEHLTTDNFNIPFDPDEASAWLDRANDAVNARHPGVGWMPPTDVAATGPLDALPFPVPEIIQDRAVDLPHPQEQEDADVAAIMAARRRGDRGTTQLPPL